MTPANIISILTARMHAVTSMLPGQPGATAALLSAAVNRLEAGILEAQPNLDAASNARDSRLGEARAKQVAARGVLLQGQAGLITFARQAAPPAEPLPGTPPVGGGGGGSGGGGGLPAQAPPPVEPPGFLESLFEGDGPWYQKPGYLIGGAVVLGAVAIAITVASGKKKPAAAPRQEE